MRKICFVGLQKGRVKHTRPSDPSVLFKIQPWGVIKW